ncbi:MAG TPA: nuclear transport factor 2 family protein [Acidimicrobiales bacterium]
MPPPTDDEVRAALDHLAITRLQSAYGDAVTRRAWDELDDMFVRGCPVRLDLRGGSVVETTGPAEIAAFIAAAVERFDFFAFTIVNTVVEVDPAGDAATGRLYIRELRHEREGGRWSTAYGLYRDAYRRDGGRWRFAARDYASLARTAAGGAGMDVFDVPGRMG